MIKFDDLRFMSIGNNCVYLSCLPKSERIRGPVDNVSNKSVATTKLLLDNKYYDFIKNTSFEKVKKKPGEYRVGDCEYICTFPGNTVAYIHNILEGQKFFDQLKIRCDNLNDFIPKVSLNETYWLLLTLNGNFAKYGTGELYQNNLLEQLSYLKDKNLLQKTIVLGSKVIDCPYKVFNHYLSDNSLTELKKSLNFNYIELTNVNALSQESTNWQFRYKCLEYINNIKGI